MNSINDNNLCYTIKELNISEGAFDKIIDCCYVLVMENSPRKDTIVDRLAEKYPSKKIKIQYNKIVILIF